MSQTVSYLPILTTVVALAFSVVVFRRYAERGGQHLLWWAIGLVAYGAGAGTEAFNTLFGWHESAFRAWYITGALLGGAPLAQGTVYLLLRKRTADRLAVALTTVIVAASICVVASPIDIGRVQPLYLTGRLFVWQWVRLVSPFVNLYALSFLVGGAAVSALRARQSPSMRYRFVGNVYIAAGGLLPGIGGSFTRFGHTSVLYVTELLGLLLIFTGYRTIVDARASRIGIRAAPPVGSVATAAPSVPAR